MKAIKFFERYSYIFFFVIYFFIGFSIVDDFGISIDEEFQRYSGFYWLCYVLEFLPFDQFKSEALVKLNNISGFTLPNPKDYPFYGVFFDYAPLFFGRVVDMFYFPIFSGTYPDWIPYVGGDRFVFFRFIFNIADSSITVGAFLLLIFHNRIPVK